MRARQLEVRLRWQAHGKVIEILFTFNAETSAHDSVAHAALQ